MASRRPRKPAPSKRAARAARKSVATRRRSPARKSASWRRPTGRQKKAARPHSLLFKLCFWPFLLVGCLTGTWPAVLRWPARAAGGLAVLGFAVFLAGAIAYYARSLPYDLGRVAEMPARSTILDRRGNEIGRLHGANRYIVSLDEVSPNFRKALLAREDKRFYDHFGIDPLGIARAIKENVTRGRFAQGASTISMQLSRNAFGLLTDGAWWEELDRKFLEIALTFRIEARYSKDEILQHYMNLIYWGGSVHGIEAASRTYLEKPARDLTLSEAAMLAGIIRAPNAFSPFEDLEKTKRERDTTLDSMVRYAFITPGESDTAKAEPLHIRPEHRRIIHDSYAMDAIRRDLERILAERNIKLGGLTITTTIDLSLQQSAERALDKHLRGIERQSGYRHQTRLAWQNTPASKRGTPQYLQGSVVMIENRTGAVLVVVGGRNADESKFNRALHARRQIGSVFKPFVYLTAFNKGLLPGTYISDERIKPGEIKGAPKDWSPANSDGKYLKTIEVKEGLVKSRNTSSVRVGNFAGISEVRDIAHRAGFGKKVPKSPASFLGSWEATPWDVASAYTIFPNGGKRYRPYLIQEIRDRQGRVLYRTDPLDYRAASPGAAAAVSSILEEVTERGTASAIRSQYAFNHPAGGKTGTTDNYVDAWFVGYTSSISCAVWVGLDQPETIMDGGYGSRLALPVWAETMKTADRLQRYNFGSLTSKFPTVPCRLCHFSGKRATPGCEAAHAAYTTALPADLVPSQSDFCVVHPLRAAPVGKIPPSRPAPVGKAPPPRAVPVRESRQPLRAIPVEPSPRPPLRAIPVNE